jgi:hypothetical protein
MNDRLGTSPLPSRYPAGGRPQASDPGRAEEFGHRPCTGAKLVRMSFLDYMLTLITLASLFILGPAIGHALVSCFNWQKLSPPVQHLVVGLCTMAAMSGMILAYGFLWERSPKSVAWYSWIQDVTAAGRVNPTLPIEVRQPLRR